MSKRFIYAVTTANSVTHQQLDAAFKLIAFQAADSQFKTLLIEEAFVIPDTDPWQVIVAGDVDTLRRIGAERDDLRADLLTARDTLRAVTADRDRLLGELQSARASLQARRLTIAYEVGAEAHEDMCALRARAGAYKKTRAALAEKYGKCDAEEWQRLCMENASAMIALQTLREKLGV